MAGKDDETSAKKADDNSAMAKSEGAKSEAKSGEEAKGAQSGSHSSSASASGSGAQSGASVGNGARSVTSGERAAHDAIALLTADHRKVEQLFARYERASQAGEKARIAHEICNSLIVHTFIEEEIFYPVCRERLDDEDPVEEAQVEHDSAKMLIVELLQGDPEDRFYDAKVTVLAEQIRHHVGEEERPKDGIFARLQASGVDTAALGREIEQFKAELMRLVEAGRLPRPITPSFRAGLVSPRFTRPMMEDEDMAQYYQQDYGQGRSLGRGGSRTGGGMGNDRPRDEYGRFLSYDDDDDDRGGRPSRGYSLARDRDERGRFLSDDESYRGGGRSRYSDDDDYRSRGSSRTYSRSRYSDDEDDGRGQGRGGWFGDSEGHSRASRLGWERSDHEGSGWYGDPERHSRASRLGWEHREEGAQGGRSRSDDDDYYRRGSSGGRGRGSERYGYGESSGRRGGYIR